ncbi:MAG TPA: ribosomal protein S18-alanine N-acetyltransferase [Myxococcota bacterium]|nr:ribosomal protein S18-alanine N-acetyltransferase [Myxococcota bacterium]
MVEIGLARVEDAAEIAALAKQTLPEAWSAPSFRAALERRSVLGLCARRGESLAGFALAACADADAEILSIAVTEAERGAGLGRRLLESLLAGLRKRGAARVQLEVRGSNAAALRLYESLGFRTARRRARYYRDGEDALELGVAL